MINAFLFINIIPCKEGWAPKNWCFQIVVLEKTLENPLDCKEAKPVHPKGNQPWIFIGRTYAEAEAPILWLPDVKSQLSGKDPDAGKDWGQEEKGMTEDEMVGWHHRLNGHEWVHGVAETEQKQHTAWDTNNSRHMSRWNNHCRQPWKCHIHYGNTLPQLGFPRRRHWIVDCARSLLGRTLGFNPCAGEGRSGTGRVRRQDVM